MTRKPAAELEVLTSDAAKLKLGLTGLRRFRNLC